MIYYKLENFKPVPITLKELIEQDLPASIPLKRTKLTILDNTYLISTVFITINMSFNSEIPINFETMIFLEEGIDEDLSYQERYLSYDKAIVGHAKAIEYIKNKRINE